MIKIYNIRQYAATVFSLIGENIQLWRDTEEERNAEAEDETRTKSKIKSLSQARVSING
jgi:adenine-specific DNA methylase